MKEIKAIIQPFMLQRVCTALREIEGLPGITVSQVIGWGTSRAVDAREAVQEARVAFERKTKVVVPAALAETVVAVIEAAARTANVGDGTIFVYDGGEVVRIRAGECGEEAI